MRSKKKTKVAMGLIAILGASGALAATFNDTWIDSSGKAVSGRDGTTRQTRSTEQGQTTGAVPSFSMNMVTIIGENTAKAIGDLAAAFGDKDELVAKCIIPKKTTLVMKSKAGAPENIYSRVLPQISSVQVSDKYNDSIKYKFYFSGQPNWSWVGRYSNASAGSRYYEYKEIITPQRSIFIKLSKSRGYSMYVDTTPFRESLQNVSDVSGLIFQATSDPIEVGVFNQPIVSYLLGHRGYSTLYLLNRQGRDVVVTTIYRVDDDYGSYTNVERFDESKAIVVTSSHLSRYPTATKSEISPYWFGYDDGRLRYGEMYRSSGRINILNGFAIVNADHVQFDGKFTRTIQVKIAPLLAEDSQGKITSAFLSPFIVSGGSNISTPLGGVNEGTYFKNVLDTTSTAPFANIVYPVADSTIKVECTLD